MSKDNLLKFYKETRLKEADLNGRCVRIPEEWEVVRLEELIKHSISGDWGKESPESEEFIKARIIRGTDFDNVENRNLEDLPERFVEKTSFNKRRVREDSVLVEISGGSDDQPTGRILKVPEEIAEKYSLIPTNFVRIFFLNTKKILPLYFTIFWKRLYSKGITRYFENRTTNIRNFQYKDFLKTFHIPLPPLEEQKKIAHVLKTIDDAIESVQKSIEKIERIKKGLMDWLLTKGVVLGFMFDTNVFNAILDNKVSLPLSYNYYVTHIQKDEIEATKDPERKSQLLKIFKEIPSNKIPTESAVWDISKWGEAKFGDEELFNKMLKRLRELDRKKKKSEANQKRDILIAETAIKNGLILVSEDSNLRKVVKEFGGVAISLKQFLRKEFRRLKKSELGEIPEEWEVVRLETIAKNMYYGITARAVSRETEFKMLRTTDINNYQANWEKLPFCEITDPKKDVSKYVLKAGDLIVARAGTVGVSVIVSKNMPNTIFGSYLIKIELDRSEADPNFIHYYLQSRYYWTQIKQSAAGGVLKNISLPTLKSIKIPLPPLQEQKKIAQILRTIDEAIETKRKKKEKLERMKKAVMDLLLTGKVRVR